MGSEQEKGYESRYAHPHPTHHPYTHPPCSTGQSEIRVLKDDVPLERTEYNDREVADSDKQLGTLPHNPPLPYLLCMTTLRRRQSVTRKMPLTRATSSTNALAAR